MALFKPMVGADKTALDAKSKVEGYVWFTTTDGKFYIDWNNNGTLTRSILNAGHADTATAFSSNRTIALTGAVTGSASTNGASGWSITATIAEKLITPTDITTTFRTQTKGDANAGAYLSVLRSDSIDSWGYMPQHGSGIAFGRQDTQTYLYTDYRSSSAYLGGGNGNKLNWVKRIAFTDGTGASGTWGINVTGSSASCTGNAATATKLATSRALTIGNTSKNFNGNSDVSWSLKEIGAMATDGSTYQVSLTGGDGNTSGYRLIGQVSVIPWTYGRLSFIVASRHSGNGLVTINYGCDNNTVSVENDYCYIKYFGISESKAGYPVSADSFSARVSADGTTIYFFWHYYDYNQTYITVLGKRDSFVPNNGTWTTDPSTYGSLIASTQINVADSLSSALALNKGGTGATTAAGARANLAVVGYTLVPELTGGSDFASTEYLPTAGGTMTGALRLNSTLTGTSGTFSGNLKAATVEGAVWNDYAEYRELEGLNEPGRCVVEIGNDKLAFSTGRLAPCAYIISDTFGFSIGKTETAKTPVAVAGRVLAYTYEDRNNFNIGDAVCSGPNGTISKMTRPEIMQYPERIIGIVSSIPDYEIWNDKVTINNRIWIKIK